MKPDSSRNSWEAEIQPHQTIWSRLDHGARRLLPGIICFFIIIICAAPLPVPGITEILPAFMITTVFFWSAWHPSSMTSPVVFLLGLSMDFVNFTPLGVSALLLLLVHSVAFYSRFGITRLPFLLSWLIFAFIALGVCLLQWSFACLFRLHILTLSPALFEATLCVGFYPALSVLFSWVIHKFNDREDI